MTLDDVLLTILKISGTAGAIILLGTVLYGLIKAIRGLVKLGEND